MDFTIKNLQRSAVDISRSIGYVIIDTTATGEYNLVRKFGGGNYPRFHVYLKQNGTDYNFSLHLDQKAPVYGARGVHAHNGEYFGPVVGNEAARIKEAVNNND